MPPVPDGGILLGIDIGNTSVSLGGLRGDRVLFRARLKTDPARSPDQYAADIRAVLDAQNAGPVRRCVLCSVVPPVTDAVRRGAAMVCGSEPLTAGVGLHSGVEVRADDPRQVGPDRVVIAAGALAERRPPLILIDMGTAITLEVLEPENVYLGGLILPGVRTALDALSAKAARLPPVPLDTPPGPVIARNTLDCMRGGALYGAAAALDGLIDRMEAELGHPSALVATGGDAARVIPLCRHAIELEEDLLLRGLAVLDRLNP